MRGFGVGCELAGGEWWKVGGWVGEDDGRGLEPMLERAAFDVIEPMVDKVDFPNECGIDAAGSCKRADIVCHGGNLPLGVDVEKQVWDMTLFEPYATGYGDDLIIREWVLSGHWIGFVGFGDDPGTLRLEEADAFRQLPDGRVHCHCAPRVFALLRVSLHPLVKRVDSVGHAVGSQVAYRRLERAMHPKGAHALHLVVHDLAIHSAHGFTPAQRRHHFCQVFLVVGVILGRSAIDALHQVARVNVILVDNSKLFHISCSRLPILALPLR